ncbi:hypothetical protein BHM03_00006433 [Ensete ventricosum]|nr:hypothetical protein BHM03_00006433 [Ensete ventricosum]
MPGVAKVLRFPVGSVIGTSDDDDEDIIMPKTKLKPNAKLAAPTKLQAKPTVMAKSEGKPKAPVPMKSKMKPKPKLAAVGLKGTATRPMLKVPM